MSIVLHAYDIEDKEVNLPKILSFRYTITEWGVERTFIASLAGVISETIVKLNATLDGKQIFNGFIDKMSRSIGVNGDVSNIKAKDFVARIKENHVRPANVVGMTPKILFNAYIKPYGITKHDFYGNTSTNMQIRAGMSAWQVVNLYCRKVYQNIAFIDAENTIQLVRTKNTNIRIGFDGLPFTSITKIEDRSKMCSTVYMQNEDNKLDFPHRADSSIAKECGIKRVWYYRTPDQWVHINDRGATQVVRDSKRKSNIISINIPQYVSLYPGDVVTIYTNKIDTAHFYVHTISFVLDENGPQTKLILWDSLRI